MSYKGLLLVRRGHKVEYYTGENFQTLGPLEVRFVVNFIAQINRGVRKLTRTPGCLMLGCKVDYHDVSIWDV